MTDLRLASRCWFQPRTPARIFPEFLRQCAEALPTIGVPFEVMVVDDGSSDATASVLRDLKTQYPFLQVVTHLRQRGIADALRSAADVASGDVLVFYPADLQYRPEDVGRLVAPILADDADIVTGTKQGKYEKAFVSMVYNTLCRWLFGIRVTDLNSVKAFRRDVMLVQPLRPDFHRYMVVIAAAEGFRLTSTPVPLYPRNAGVSKFTWHRIPVGVLDLLSVWFQLRLQSQADALLRNCGRGALLRRSRRRHRRTRAPVRVPARVCGLEERFPAVAHVHRDDGCERLRAVRLRFHR